jgi:DNA-3-methyladenine glycosylase II
MYLRACAGRADVWPVGEVALRTAVGRAFEMGRRAEEEERVEMGEGWRPWRAVAARVLWGYYRKS